MNQTSNPVSRRFRRLALMAVIAGVTAVTVAEQVTVQQVTVKNDVNVKSDKNPFSDPVETVSSDTILDVVSRDAGWLRVRTPSGKEGFISEGDLPPQTNLASVQGAGGASSVSNDAALRGLQDDADRYAKSKGYNTASVEKMVKLGKSITDNELISFGKAGHVGPAKYRQ